VTLDRARGWGADVLHGGEHGGDGHVVVGGHSHRADWEFGGARAHGVEWPRGDQVWCPVPRPGAFGVRDPGRQCAIAAASARGVWVVRDPDVDRRASHLPIG